MAEPTATDRALLRVPGGIPHSSRETVRVPACTATMSVWGTGSSSGGREETVWPSTATEVGSVSTSWLAAASTLGTSTGAARDRCVTRNTPGSVTVTGVVAGPASTAGTCQAMVSLVTDGEVSMVAATVGVEPLGFCCARVVIPVPMLPITAEAASGLYPTLSRSLYWRTVGLSPVPTFHNCSGPSTSRVIPGTFAIAAESTSESANDRCGNPRIRSWRTITSEAPMLSSNAGTAAKSPVRSAVSTAKVLDLNPGVSPK